MKNTELAKKIKELRTSKGLSQDELAQSCGLSLRTIQRIENGETEPRGDSLRRLAVALNTSPDELIDWSESEDNRFLAALNLSALSYIAFPILGIIIPLAIWILKKDKIKGLDYTGKKLLNFQISWSILLFTVYLIIFSSVFGSFRLARTLGGMEGIVISIVGLYVFNGILIVINTIRSLQSKKVFYQPAIPFLR
ncbi:MAG: helix-turn-helix domain-containing protein [Pyrinomonadaceae bacterium]|nr:helix-turn-helix domain-containing protein [Sphingobacteriaceae bacterium]